MARKARSADIVQRVYDVIEQMLCSFEIQPRERLNESRLASQLNVSRTPVREALNRLSTVGLATLIPNKGFFARPLGTEEVVNLSALRAGVEGIAIQTACVRASDDAIAALANEWADAVRQAEIAGSSELTQVDETFHEGIVGLAGNSELLAAVRNINVRLRFFRQCVIEHPGRRLETASEHSEILAALEKRDAGLARELLERQVMITRADATDFISRGLAKIYLRPRP